MDIYVWISRESLTHVVLRCTAQSFALNRRVRLARALARATLLACAAVIQHVPARVIPCVFRSVVHLCDSHQTSKADRANILLGVTVAVSLVARFMTILRSRQKVSLFRLSAGATRQK